MTKKQHFIQCVEVFLITIFGLAMVAGICLVGYLIMNPFPANGHPPEDCPKVESKVTRSHFLSVPIVTAPPKEDKLKAFQKKHGLKVDGLIGHETCNACIDEFVR